MSRIVITNLLGNWKEMKQDLENAGFPCAFEENTGSMVVSGFKKLKGNGGGYSYSKAAGEFIIACGTIVYREETGPATLQRMYEALAEENKTIQQVRADMFGTYAVAYCHEGTLRIFTDETTSLNLYYFYDRDTGKFMVTNTTYHIAKYAGVEVEPTLFVEYRGLGGRMLDNATLYKGIYTLFGEQCITVDVTTNEVRIEKVPLNDYHRTFANAEEAAKEIAAAMKEWARVRKKCFPNCTLFQTGGIDSRVELASYTQDGETPTALTWFGRDGIMNSKETDLQLSQQICEKTNTNFVKHNAVTNFAKDCETFTEKDFDRYGEYSTQYSLNRKWFAIFENQDVEMFYDCGLRGELMGPSDEYEIIKGQPVTFRELDEKVLCGPLFYENVANAYGDKEALFKRREEEGEAFLQELGYAPDALITEKMFKKFDNRRRMRGDRCLMPIANLFGYGSMVLDQKKALDLVESIDFAWLDKYHQELLVLKELDERMLEIPFFCHCRPRIFDAQNMCLLEVPLTTRQKLREKTKAVLRKLHLLKPLKAIRDKVAPPYDYHFDETNMEQRLYSLEKCKSTKTYSLVKLNLNEKTFKAVSGYSMMYTMLLMNDYILEHNAKTKQ